MLYPGRRGPGQLSFSGGFLQVPKDKREGKTEYLQSYELQKITEFKVEYDDPRYCNSYEELLAFAKKKGYKSGWAWYQAKNRGLI